MSNSNNWKMTMLTTSEIFVTSHIMLSGGSSYKIHIHVQIDFVSHDHFVLQRYYIQTL